MSTATTSPAAMSVSTEALLADLDALVDVLAGAATIARNFWHFDEFDIYECFKRSWLVREIPTAYTTVFRAVRRAAPDGDLAAFNEAEGRTREQVGEFFAGVAMQVAADRRRIAARISQRSAATLVDTGDITSGARRCPQSSDAQQLELFSNRNDARTGAAMAVA